MAQKKPADRYLNVAVMGGTRDPLTYRVPEGLSVRAGQRVLVPLGTRRAAGVALESPARPAPGFKIRDVLRVLDPEPLLSPELLTLGLWIGEYYLAPIGEVFRAMLPLRPETRRVRLARLTESGERKLDELNSSLLEEVRSGREAALLRYVAERSRAGLGAAVETLRHKFRDAPELLDEALASRWLAVTEAARERGRRKLMVARLTGPLPERLPQLSPASHRILEALERAGPAEDHRSLLKSARADRAALEKLSQAGWIELCDALPPPELPDESAPAPQPTEAQAAVLADLMPRLDSRRFQVVLLHGITASGKTEVYLRLMARCLEAGRAVLMLVPEIGLTPAVQAQVRTRFGQRVTVLHSALGENERHEAWWRARRGEAKLVLGTRSAVFAPLDNLGLIIVDEEHDSSYKQEETPRYHGRDVAVVRGRLAGALVVLGSATPSLDSAWNARQGKYHLVKLEERIGRRPLAPVEIIDMREEFRQTLTQVPISRRLKEEMEAQLRAGAQTMILLNRRGYSWFVLCRSCGQTQRCVNCSISLTYHQREHRMRCHYCGYSAPVPARCPECGSEYLQFVGEGTEKLEARLAELFPGARVERLDRDVASRATRFAQILSEFRRGEIQILVGTQLISKGHDFPGVTLVGVVSVDTGLSLPDFRAAERTFQLLTQAAGRAGRGEAPGRVLVQTFYPDHYAIRLAAEQNYDAFFSKEMAFRRMMHYPPCTALANVIAQSERLEQAARVARQIGEFFAQRPVRERGFKILGPSPPPLARIKGRHRIQFLVKADSRAKLNETLRQLLDDCERHRIPSRTVMIDLDPANIL